MSDEQRVAPRHSMDHIDPETIAAWLDEPDDLSSEERAAIAQHLAGCTECQQVAADLRVVVAALAVLPDAALPRSFALPIEHAHSASAALREPTPIRSPGSWYDRQMRALRWATAAAAILFVVVLGLDLVTTRIDRPTNDAAVMSMEQTAGGAAQAAATEEPPAAKAESAAPTAAAAGAALVASPEATSAGSEAAPAADQAAVEGAASPDDTASAVREQSDLAARETNERPVVSQREERLRSIEFGLAALFVCLLASMIALPRLQRRRGNHS